MVKRKRPTTQQKTTTIDSFHKEIEPSASAPSLCTSSRRRKGRLHGGTATRRTTRAMTKAVAALGTASAAIQMVSSLPANTSPLLSPVSTKMIPSVVMCAKQSKGTARTESFEALWAGNLPSVNDPTISVHTLILGTHPSITSLEKHQYFGHPLNAFWWIAGDCLGFRRGSGRNKSGDYYRLDADLRYGDDAVIPYEKQLAVMVSNGFALWDLVQSCQRPGSLDADIRDEIPNDICGFCQEHPTIQRIVLANGGTSAQLFKRHFREWWASGELLPASNHEASRKLFQSVAKLASKKKEEKELPQRRIECLSAMGVSPAAAKYTYAEKRDFWDEHVYSPGLELHQILNKNNGKETPKA